MASRAPRRASRPTPVVWPEPSYRHLCLMTDGTAVFEHAWGRVPRWEHGYCTDDVSRTLLVVARAVPTIDDADRLDALAAMALGFLRVATLDGCPVRTRMDHRRNWVDEGPTGDTDGRVLWALGVAATESSSGWVRDAAAALFASTAASFDAPSPRSVAFAAIGAAQVSGVGAAAAGATGAATATGATATAAARALLARLRDALARPVRSAADGSPAPWPWPEARLTYANASVCEALVVAGAALDDDGLVQDGLALLDWLWEVETGPDGLSLTPVAGRGPGELGPAYDQQPIDAAALCDACWMAWRISGDERWAHRTLDAAAWFLGRNDAGLVLYDAASGAGHDGLHADAVNANCGAESTLAALMAMQRAQSVVAALSASGQDPSVANASSRARSSIKAAPTQRSAAP